MSDVTRAGKRRLKPLRRFLDLLDQLVSARADERARRMGFTVTRVPGSRVHLYRDPRWDQRREAMRRGTGAEPELLDLSEQP